MKKICAAFLVLLFAGFYAGPTMAGQRVYYGYPLLQEAQDGQIWVLTQDGQETARLGSFENNKKVQECLQEAFGLNEMIRFSGNWEKKENYFELNPATAQCAKITKKADCPQKVLRTVTIDAAYLGVVCGDFCHLELQPEYGDAFSVYADETEVEKLFGPKPGKKVQVTYTVEMDWMSDNFENPDSPEGSCGISTYFKSGRVLGK